MFGCNRGARVFGGLWTRPMRGRAADMLRVLGYDVHYPVCSLIQLILFLPSKNFPVCIFLSRLPQDSTSVCYDVWHGDYWTHEAPQLRWKKNKLLFRFPWPRAPPTMHPPTYGLTALFRAGQEHGLGVGQGQPAQQERKKYRPSGTSHTHLSLPFWDSVAKRFPCAQPLCLDVVNFSYQAHWKAIRLFLASFLPIKKKKSTGLSLETCTHKNMHYVRLALGWNLLTYH